MKFLFSTMLPFHAYPSYKRATGLGEALAEAGHEVYILALDCEENRRRLTLESPNCNTMLFKQTNAIAEAHFKLKCIWHVRPDYVYTPTYGLRNLMGLSCLFPKATKLLQEINELNSSFQGRHTRIWKFIEKLALREADCQVCASKKLLAHTQKQCEALKLSRQMIYLPFAYPKYIHPRFGKVSNKRHVVYFGAIYKDYGVFDILSAANRICKERSDLVFDFIGAGPDLPSLNAKTAKFGLHNQVNTFGYVKEEEIDTLLSNADVFIAPLHDTDQDWYRCPSKIYYYIAYNKPIVTCKIGDAFDALKSHGFYYRPTDVDDMIRAICNALDANMFSYPEGFIENHSWHTRAQTLLTFLNDNPH